jgi:hypothetical protein
LGCRLPRNRPATNRMTFKRFACITPFGTLPARGSMITVAALPRRLIWNSCREVEHLRVRTSSVKHDRAGFCRWRPSRKKLLRSQQPPVSA